MVLGQESKKQSASGVNAHRPAKITVAWRHDKFACQGRMGTNSKDLFPFVFLDDSCRLTRISEQYWIFPTVKLTIFACNHLLTATY